jgi:hypothetical protein
MIIDAITADMLNVPVILPGCRDDGMGDAMPRFGGGILQTSMNCKPIGDGSHLDPKMDPTYRTSFHEWKKQFPEHLTGSN